jgi:hypothetical protein
MTDTSNADNSPDAQDDAPPPSSWTPPRGAPSPLSSLAGAASDTGVWQRGQQVRTPDQPTTVSPQRQQFPGIPDQPPPPLDPPPRDGPPEPPPIGLSLRHPMPFRPRPIQRYFPPLPNRSWQDWGQPRQFSPEPQPWEVLGIYGNVARFFTQNGSGFTAPTAAMLGVATQGHSKAYMEGQSAALRILEERMKISAQALDDKSYQEQKDYRDAFALGGGDVGTWSGDPKAKDATELHDRLFEVATKYNDKPMLAALESGNLQRAENILKERDAQGTSLRESVAQQRKDDEQRKAEAPYREGGTPPPAAPDDTSTPATSADGMTPEGGAAPPSSPAEGPATLPGAGPGDKAPVDPGYDVPDNQAQAQAQARGQPGVQVAEAGASDAPVPGMQRLAQAQPQAQFTPTPSQVLQDAANDKDRITGKGFAAQPIEDWAQKLVNHTATPTAKGLPGVPPRVFEYAQLRANEIEKDLDRIQADPKIKGGDVLPAVRKVDPQFADALKAYVAGRAEVPKSARYQGLINRVLGLGSKIDPGFNEQTFRNRARVFADFSAGNDARTLVAVATAYSHLHALRDSLDHIPSLQASALGQVRGIGKLVSSPEERAMIGKLDNEVVTASSEYERALVGGKPTQTAREGSERELNWRTMDPDTLKANVDDKIARLQERMQKLQQQFVGGSGAQPGAMFKMFDQFSRSGMDQPQQGDDARELAAPGQTEILQQLQRERPAAPPAAPRSLDDYKPGFTRGGYRFKGGDPTDQSNWEQVQ